jgi:hypothetical protein
MILRRREIIDAWLKSEKYLDSYCCPNCRNILDRLSDNCKAYLIGEFSG